MKESLKRAFFAFILFFIIIASASAFAAEGQQQYRFFQFFVEDAAIVPTQWWEGQLRFISDGQYRSFNVPDSDTLAISPIVAFSPRDDFEIGAILSVEDIDYDSPLLNEKSGSGLSDTDIYGKYRIKKEPFELTFGVLATLPTGDEDEGRGTGKLNVELFGAARKSIEHGMIINGVFGFRLNRDATLLGVADLDAKTSIILGGGFIYPMTQTLALSGEISIESERYENADTDIRVTPGLQFKAFKNSLMRVGLGVGLTDGAPDFEAIASYVYTF